MKKKFFLILICATVFTACVSCSQNSDPTSTQTAENSTSISSTASDSQDKESSQSEEVVTPDASDGTESENIGNEDFCMAHKFLYHSYSSQLLDYVGYENFEAWGELMRDKPNEEVNIVSFVEYFQIPKETLIAVERANYTEDDAEYDGVTMLSLEQIDAIYSGDKKLINETFCGPLAFVNEADGELYSIYWLAEHTAEDYAAAQLPLDEVENVLQNAAEKENGERYDLIEKVEPKLTQAYALEEAALAETEPSAGTAVPEESNETAETGTESSAVVQDETAGSNPAE